MLVQCDSHYSRIMGSNACYGFSRPIVVKDHEMLSVMNFLPKSSDFNPSEQAEKVLRINNFFKSFEVHLSFEQTFIISMLFFSGSTFHPNKYKLLFAGMKKYNKIRFDMTVKHKEIL